MYKKRKNPMKNLVLFLVVFISFSLSAQGNLATNNEWMVKISSDSVMRVKMMDMIIEKTKGNEEEMRKIVNSISNDTKLYQMIVETYPEKAGSEYISVEPYGKDNDNIKVGVMSGTKPVPKPKQ
jgi:hypothetical protein